MKKIVLGIVAVVLIGVGGTVAALYTQTWNPMWNPFRPDPEVVIKEMAIKMNSLDAVHSDTRIDLGIQGEKSMNVLLNLSMDSDSTDESNPKSKGVFELDLSSEGITVSGAGETISVGQTSYFKINEIPSLGESSQMMSGIISSIKGKWIRVGQDDLEVLSEEFGQEYDALSEEEQEEILNKVKNLLEERDLYYVEEELMDEEINGKMTYHYILALDQEAVKEFVPELIEVFAADYLGEGIKEVEIDEMEEELSTGLDDFFEKVGPLKAEVWVGQKDYYLYQVKVDKEVDLSRLSQSTEVSSPVEGNLLVLLEMNFSDFNKPISIEEPQDYQSITKLIQTLQELMIQSMMGGM